MTILSVFIRCAHGAWEIAHLSSRRVQWQLYYLSKLDNCNWNICYVLHHKWLIFLSILEPNEPNERCRDALKFIYCY